MYFEIVRQMTKQLGQLDKWLEAAAAHARAKQFDSSVYMSSRLAPDQFAFARQVQSACDTVKLGSARITGKDAPNHPDTEQTLEELHTRVKSTIAFVETLTAKDFEGAAKRVITTARWEGKVMSGADYFVEHVVPNFYFHLGHAYAILRNNGVPIGKRDYLGALTMSQPS